MALIQTFGLAVFVQTFTASLNEVVLTGNDIGNEGAKALAAALEPKRQPDGTWVSV